MDDERSPVRGFASCRGSSVVAFGGLAGAGLLLTGCAAAPSALDPRGPRAEQIADLWWLMLGIGTLVWLVVVGLLLWAIFRGRRRAEIELPLDDNTEWIVWGGIILPFIILLILYGFTLRTLSALAAPNEQPDFTIEIVGNQWWWEVRYITGEQQIVTANEIHLPLDEPVLLRVTSDDVIHSLWVPQLMGKIDLIPGQTNTLWLEADEPGAYYGECAEFCGIQHARMQFIVVAQPRDEFLAWLDHQAEPAIDPSEGLARLGQQVFLASTCVYCHTVRGTSATGEVGPDLTHLDSRLTIAAGTLPNTKGNLAGWIIDPQSIKPGNLMPPTDLTGVELQALLAYLQSLD